MTYDPPNFATLNGFTAHVVFLHELSLASQLGWLGNKSIEPINILASPSSLLAMKNMSIRMKCLLTDVAKPLCVFHATCSHLTLGVVDKGFIDQNTLISLS